MTYGAEPEACVPDLFSAQAARTPDEIAVVCGERELTYRELADSADRVAGRLRALGVGPDTLVALCVDRSVDLVVGMLGILQAGGAYLPVEPATPPERAALILRLARPHVLLTQRRLAERLPTRLPSTVLLDDLPLAGEPPPARPTEPSSLAYVIYTSGSTGVPKGVGVDHRALRDRIRGKIGIFGFGTGDRILLFSGVSFDAAGSELYPALLSGAAVVILPDPPRTSPEELLELCVRQGVTGVMLPPVFWRLVIDSLSSSGASLPWLRFFLTGGESIPVEQVAQWVSLNPHRPRFLYAYGPTEATIATTIYESSMKPDEIRALEKIPVGKPMPGTRVLLLDNGLGPVSVGEVGEIYITGSGLARGYLNEPALTAERFLPCPGEPGARMYRTGDLARLTATADLEFVGRVDEQVKVRGFRVDLGDVEAALALHPGLCGSAVVLRDGMLTAYCVPVERVALASADVRRFLRERLPDYMIPSSVSMLPALPVTPGGKIDRQALPEPVESSPEAAPGGRPPASPIEQALASIWCELLRRETVSLAEDFFALGGDSLLANRLVTRVRDRLGVDLPLRDVFTNPTVAELAAAITVLAMDAAEGNDMLDLLAELEETTETT